MTAVNTGTTSLRGAGVRCDLLLRRAPMHDDDPHGTALNIARKDGLGNGEDAPDAEYGVWQGEGGADGARVHFFHGALRPSPARRACEPESAKSLRRP